MVRRWQEYAAEVMAEDLRGIEDLGCSLVDTGEYAVWRVRMGIEDGEGWERDERGRIVGGWVPPYLEGEL